MKKELLVSVLTGRSGEKTARIIQERFGVNAYCARRIVRTESAYVANAAQMSAYSEAGIERYRFIATLDSKTSEVCAELDGKVFEAKDARAGTNYPPMHPFCRSTTIADFGEDELKGLERRAKDEDGNTVKVSADMGYDEWYRKFVENGDKMSNVSNDWRGAKPTPHSAAELEELNQYAAGKGIRLYRRKPFDGNVDLLKAQIDTVANLREEFHITDHIQIGWKPMKDADFGETSSNHHEIWINELALRNRAVTEQNLSIDNYLVPNTAEGVAAHEMGHVISG